MRRAAFTIIELCMVIAIMSILSLVVFSQFKGAYVIKGKMAAQRLVSDIRYAQALAAQRHSSCGVVLDTANNSYYVYIGNTGVKAQDPFSKEDLEVAFDTDPECEGVKIVSSNFGNQLVFDTMGAPTLATAGQIILEYEREQYTILIEPQTGRAYVQ